MPVHARAGGGAESLGGRVVDRRGVVFAAVLAVGVALGLVAIAPGEDAGMRGAPAGVPSLVSGGERVAVAQRPTVGASDAYGKLPLAFEPNRGQSDGRVRFLARGAGYG